MFSHTKKMVNGVHNAPSFYITQDTIFLPLTVLIFNWYILCLVP